MHGRLVRPIPLMLLLLHSGAALAADAVAWEMDGLNQPVMVQALATDRVLITERGNSRLIEATATRPLGGALGSPLAVDFPNSGRRLPNGHTLSAYSGASDGMQELDADGQPFWSLNNSGPCNPLQIRIPSDFLLLPNGDPLAVSYGFHRLLELGEGPPLTLVWSYGRADCAPGTADGELSNPSHVEIVANGDYLVAQAGSSVVTQLHRAPGTTTIAWEYGRRGTPGTGPNQLNGPTHATQLSNGNVLVADALNDRVVEIAPTLPTGGTVVWTFGVPGVSGADAAHLNLPSDAQRTSLGTTVIADTGNNRILEISPLRLALSAATPAFLTQTCAGPLQLRIEDLYGGVHPPPTTVQVDLSSMGEVELFSDPTCTTPAASLSVASGVTGDELFVRSRSPGSAQVIANASGYQGTNIAIRFDPSARNLTVGCACSTGAGAPPLWMAGVVGWVALRRLVSASRSVSAKRGVGAT